MRAIEPTLLNIVKHLFGLYAEATSFDSTIILSTTWLQMIIPLISVPVCVSFYQMYHTIDHFSFYKQPKSFQKTLFKDIFRNALKLAFSVYLACFVFMVIVLVSQGTTAPAADGRSLFSDLIGNGLYQKATFLYFSLEGFVRFFFVPFIYTCFGEAVVLLDVPLKYVAGAPLAYYYGLAVLGYSIALELPKLHIYLNPTVLMSNGDYEFNTILLLLTNAVPFFIATGIIIWKTKHIEI